MNKKNNDMPDTSLMTTVRKELKNPTEALGFSGLSHQGGNIEEEFHVKLKGSNGIKIYREMSDNSSIIGMILYLIEMLIRQLEWRVESVDESTEAKNAAMFLEECLLDMDQSVTDIISEALSFLVYGWSFFEIVYKLRKGETNDKSTNSRFNDGKFGWRKIAFRSQDSLECWVFDDDGDLIAMDQLSESTGESASIPLDKAALFRTKMYKGNPEGRSILRNAVNDYYYHKNISRLEAIGIEREFAGMPKMEVPREMLSANASASDKVMLESLITQLGQLKRDEKDFILVPSELDKEGKPTGYKFSLVVTGGSRQIDTSKVKHEYKVSILQSVLAQFLELGMSTVGSFALASSQTNLFSVATGAYLNIIKDVFDKQIISPLFKLNGVSVDLVPTLVHSDLESMPLGEIGSYLEALSRTGQLPEDDTLKRKLLEIAHLPIPEELNSVDKRRGPKPNRAPLRGTSVTVVREK